MKTTISKIAALALMLSLGACATPAAEKVAEAPVSEAPVAEAAPFKEIGVDELAGLLDAKAAVAIYDANGAETRAKFGVIPTAKLLSSYDTFQVSELPESKDAKLVFYCGSERCSAAPKAAERACSEGYTDVNVLRAGIKGWAGAQKPTQAVEAPAETTTEAAPN